MKKKTEKTTGKSFEEFDKEFGPIRFSQPSVYGDTPFSQPKPSAKAYSKAEVRQRQNKKRKLKNKFRKIIITFVAIVAFAALGIVLSLTVFFNITDINISGSEKYSLEELKSA